MEKPEDLTVRTKDFALQIIRLVQELPAGVASEVIERQLIRSATSVGANYRAARRARSKAEFEAKLQIVLEEADECVYWIELLLALGLVPQETALQARREAEELTAIFVSSLKTSRSKP
jgi:four helix bundle protein